MDKRKIYIIGAIIIIMSISALSVWYVYILQQDAKIGTTRDLPSQSNDTLLPAHNDSFGTIQNTGTDKLKIYGGNSTTSATTTATTTGTSTENIIIKPKKWHLTQLYNDAVGDAFIKNSNEVYIVDAKTGSIVSIDPQTGKQTILSHQVVEDFTSAYILNKDLVSYILKDKTEVYSIPQESTSTSTIKIIGTIKDTPANISVGKNTATYITTTDSGTELKQLSIKDIQEGKLKPKTVLKLHLSNWLVYTPNKNIYLAQKPSNSIPGYAYILREPKLSLSSAKTLLRDKPGLAILPSPKEDRFVYNTFDSAGEHLTLVVSGDEIPMYSESLVDKCSWGNDGVILYCATPGRTGANMPDSWYNGSVSTQDSIWQFDTDTGDAIELQNTTMDIMNMKNTDGLIIFQNKTDGTLWALVRE